MSGFFRGAPQINTHLRLHEFASLGFSAPLIACLRFGFPFAVAAARPMSLPRLHARDWPGFDASSPAVTAAFAAALAAGHVRLLSATELRLALAHGRGAVPKSDGSARLIFDGKPGINQHTPPVALQLPSVADTLPSLLALAQAGTRAWMWKVDLRHGYMQLALFPPHTPLTAFRHGQQWYGYTSIPFGSNQAPGQFCWFSDELRDAAIRHLGFSPAHFWVYVDDFFFIGESEDAATAALAAFLALLERLGVLVAADKTVPPSTRAKFLGIVLDSVAQTAEIPAEKRVAIREVVSTALAHHSMPGAELSTLIGFLGFVAKVFWLGRPFLTALYAVMQADPEFRSRPAIRIHGSLRTQLEWWHTALGMWTGSSWWRMCDVTLHCRLADVVTTDASGIGLGGHSATTGRHFAVALSDSESAMGNAWRELRAVLEAFRRWESHWSGMRVLIRTDNMGSLAILRKARSPHPALDALVREIYTIVHDRHIEFRVEHIAGAENTIADALSRDLRLPPP